MENENKKLPNTYIEFKSLRRKNRIYKLISMALITTFIQIPTLFFLIVFFGSNNIEYPPQFWIAPLTQLVICISIWYQYTLFHVYIESVSKITEFKLIFITIVIFYVVLMSFLHPQYWLIFSGTLLLIWSLFIRFLRSEEGKGLNYSIIMDNETIANPVFKRWKSGFWIAFTYSLSSYVAGIMLYFILKSDIPYFEKVISQLLPGIIMVCTVVSGTYIFPRSTDMLEKEIESYLKEKGSIITDKNIT